MINNLFKSTTFKLIILVCTVLSTLIFSSLLFNNQIDNLKKQVDNIYFGNLIPIVKLQSISDSYKEIITCRTMKYTCDIKKEEYSILEQWKYYNEAYKNNEERAVADAINTALLNSFKENKLHEVDVIKNTEVLYYMRNDKNQLIGINKNVFVKIRRNSIDIIEGKF